MPACLAVSPASCQLDDIGPDLRRVLGIVRIIRVNTNQQGRSGLGIEAQRAALRQFVEAESIEVLGEYVEVETGTPGSFGQPGFPKTSVNSFEFDCPSPVSS
jgi:hypothetical protein